MVDKIRIYIFLFLSFGLAWSTSLIVYVTGGLQNSPELIPGTGITLALVLIASLVMWSPALAHILTRLITAEGWQNLYLRPHIRRSWPYWLAAWFGPGLLIIAGVGVYFLIFRQQFDSSLSMLQEMIAATAPVGVDLGEINPWVIVLVQVFQGLLLAPVINSIAVFGEEFGWRAYLQPKLMPLGERKALLLLGVIWGMWHWPIILMGHNYGFEYPGAPWLGLLAMVWFTIITGIFLGWLTIKSESVWPAVIGHGAINGVASLGIVFVQGDPNPLLGPLPTGLIGGIGFSLVALWLFLRPGLLRAVSIERDQEPATA